ncbi:MAG: 30S ribosomal protein S16 [Proteobacteria bacterium]|nr:30S ribosomal protein S16 [Pseudomonadota bacterium]
MAIKIRLARAGAKKRPYYHIVVADARSPRDGRFVEKVGSYNPMLPQDNQDRIRLNLDRIKYWLSVGAQPTDRVALFLGKASVIEMPVMRPTPQKSAPKAKAQERVREAEEAQKAAAEAAAAPKVKEEVPEEVVVEAAVEETAPEEVVAEAAAEEVAPEEVIAEAAPAEPSEEATA